jgi:hypothetical protein
VSTIKIRRYINPCNVIQSNNSRSGIDMRSWLIESDVSSAIPSNCKIKPSEFLFWFHSTILFYFFNRHRPIRYVDVFCLYVNMIKGVGAWNSVFCCYLTAWDNIHQIKSNHIAKRPFFFMHPHQFIIYHYGEKKKLLKPSTSFLFSVV